MLDAAKNAPQCHHLDTDDSRQSTTTCSVLRRAFTARNRLATGEASRGGAPRRRGRGNNLRGAILRAAVAAFLILGFGLATARVALPQLVEISLNRADAVSATVLDRRDRLLRAFTTAGGRWRLPLSVDEVDPRYLAMLQAFEDRRFYSHSGVDAVAVLRAAGQFIRHGRIVSGASTLTMQVARLLEGEHERTAPGKLRQMLRAWQLERRLSKSEILRLYLLLAPFGGNIEGVRAASLAWFGKEPRRLSPGEAALLVALPQSPALRRPDRFPKRARRARDRVLDRAVAAGVITSIEAQRARLERIPTLRHEFPKLAPHLAESEIEQHSGRTVHRLTLDRDLQMRLESLVREHVQVLGERLSAALLVVDHRTGEVLAHIGSGGYFDGDRLGAIDMTQAIRSPGSTLKPLIYGLAFEAGLAHPETLIDDTPTRFGVYKPKNFDEDFHGTVTIREALTQSLNIPAVKVLAAVGPSRLVRRLRQLNLSAELLEQVAPTLAVGLGGIGLTLRDLATLYATLARGGEAVTLAHRRALAASGPRAPRLLSQVAAWYVADILKDAPPPISAKAGSIAYKTGTSYGFRDAWAVGFDGQYTIAVWVGRPEGTATPGLTGRAAAAPILFDAFARTSEARAPLPSPPYGVLRVSRTALPLPLRYFGGPAAGQAASQSTYAEPAVQIAFPPDRSELERDTDGESPAVVLKAEGGALPLTWLADGRPIRSDPARRDVQWHPGGLGFVRLSVVDASGRSDRVEFRVK